MNTIERILFLAEKKGIKQADIAKALGKGTSQITNWKTRNTDPPIEHIPKIAELLDVSIEFLITGNEKKEITEEEKELLKFFNKCNQNGKKIILEHAEFITTKYSQEGKSLNYKIG